MSPSFAGPQLPPSHFTATAATASTSHQEEEEEEEDDYSVSLPPEMLAARSAGPTVAAATATTTATASATTKTVLGPTLPPNFSTSTSSRKGAAPPRRETPLSARYLDDDDDDDSFGPMPLPQGARPLENDGAREFREREEREEEKRRKDNAGKGKMKREEWMMVPPEDVDLLSTMDSTKLKSRSFQQSAPTTSKRAAGATNLWTESPAERQQRMEDELLGKRKKAEISAAGGGDDEDTDDQRRKRERDYQLREEVDRHNKSARNMTLLDAHSKSKKGEPKEQHNGWDRDRDMAVSGRLLDDGKRSEMVKGAKELGGRFSSGSYL